MNCTNNQSSLTELARGSRMEARQCDELRAHMRQCSHCQREFDAQVRLSEAMATLSADAALMVPPPELEAALLAEFDRTLKPHAVYGFSRFWYAGAAIAACLLLAWGLWPAGRPQPIPQAAKNPAPTVTANVMIPPPQSQPLAPARNARASVRPHRKASAASPLESASPETDQPFVAIPYTAPLAPYERTDIVRMDLPVSALIAAGFPMQVADPGARARADLVVSEDGRARAVRLISISNR